MAYVEFSDYAPCGFLIVPDGGNPRNDSKTCLIQSDWDYPGVAQAMGWSLSSVQSDEHEGEPCEHSFTDGTVKCDECGIGASDFISAAYEFIREHDLETFEGLDEYLPEVSNG